MRCECRGTHNKSYGKVSKAVIEAGSPTLKAVIKMGTGIGSIDFTATRANRVQVVNCPGYARYSVAENAFILMMNCMKGSAFLINVGRGASVDELALLSVLKNRQIAR